MQKRMLQGGVCFNSQASYEARPYGDVAPFEEGLFQFTGLIRGPTL